jgi:hypothetical protein
MTEHSRSGSAETQRREARLAAALRENLRRRKAQTRARSRPAADASSAAAAPSAAQPRENDLAAGVLPQSDGE